MKKFIVSFGLVVFSLCFITNTVEADFWSDARDKVTDKFKKGADDWIDGTARDTVHDIFGPSQPDGRFELPISSDFNEIGNNTSMRGFILNVLNFVLSFLGIVAVAAIIYAGFLYISSSLDDGNAEKAKNIIVYAMIGILVVLVSYALVNTLIKNAPNGGDDRGTTFTNELNTNNTNLNINNTNSNTTNLDINDVIGSTSDTNSKINNSFFDSGPILVFVGSEQKLTDPIIVSLEDARKGLNFQLAWTDASSAWNFNNGITKVLQPGESITVRFSQAKNYQILVVIQTADGQKINSTKTIQVEDVQANFTVSKTTAIVNESIEFNGSSSKTNIGEIIDYNWTCTGGTGCFPSYSGQSFLAQFADSGKYQVTLTIESNLGSRNSETKEINISKDKPTASFEIYDDATQAGGVKLDAFASKNVTGDPSDLIYKWNFGNGERQTGGPIMFHKYDAKGSYLIELIVEESNNGKTLQSDKVSKYAKIDSVLDVDFNFTQ